jgi:hypothetical protein
MESIFLILSGVILAAGILYWFWSHIQLTQKKVQLLENAVFELREMLGSRESPTPVAPIQSAPVRPPSNYNDLADDGWEEEGTEIKEVETVSTPLEQIVAERTEPVEENDLVPGGRILPVTTEVAEPEPSAEEFREMFLQEAGPATPSQQAAAPATPASLESMPVKELRRLAEQRGIAGAAEMRKKEILAALRQQVTPTTLDLTVEQVTDESVPLE